MKTEKTLWIIAIAVIVATFIYIGIQHRRINHYKDESQLQAVELSTLKDSVLVYKSKSGELTYKLSSVEIEKDNLKKSLEIAGFDIKELKERDINWRNVTAALRAELAATGHGATTVVDTFRIEKTDTVYFQKVSDWSNGFLSISNAEILNRNLDFDYTYRTSIDFLTSGTRKGTIVSVILADPNAKIATANSITVTHKRKLWQKPWVWGLAGLGAGVFIAK